MRPGLKECRIPDFPEISQYLFFADQRTLLYLGLGVGFFKNVIRFSSHKKDSINFLREYVQASHQICLKISENFKKAPYYQKFCEILDYFFNPKAKNTEKVSWLKSSLDDPQLNQ